MNSATVIPLLYIERKPASDGYRIIGKGVSVAFLSTLLHDEAWPLERICANYGLTPAEVYAAWAFYYSHQEEIDADLAEAAERHKNNGGTPL